MLKKTITYQNLDGEDVTEDFHFQITKSEVAEKALIEGEEYGNRLRNLSVERDGAEIMRQFKSILSEAVGRREGQLLVKDQSVRNHFMFSGAYDTFFMELISSPDSGATALRSMFPKDFQETIEKEVKDRGLTTELPSSGVVETVGDAVAKLTVVDPTPAPATTGTDEDPLWLKEGRNPTRQELMKMSKDEMQLAAKMRESGLIK